MAGEGQQQAALDKWSSFYVRGLLPWDTGLPSSQLAALVSECPADWLAGGGMQPGQLTLPRAPAAALDAAAADGASLETAATPPAAAAAADSGGGGPAAGRGGGAATHFCARCAALKPPRGGDALEIGCGTGASCAFLAHMGWRVAGVDIAPAAAAAARRRAARVGGAPRCAFAEADVLRLPEGFCWEDAKRLERQQALQDQEGQHQGQQQQQEEQGKGGGTPSIAAPAPTAAAAAGTAAGGARGAGAPGFDFIYDCQAFHVLWEQDADGAAAALARLLRPGGLLMLLTGNALEPECGPNVLTEPQLRAAFGGGGWEWVWLTRSRFDETLHYRDVLGKRPLAWWALLRRR
ncbi:MAG: S-adenosyl-L-methionine-dependent methyltransferase [Monoraphidium minutum]|nr:MAG: S-adenosyl-L-methionine-dependent methyltransferase [Monoraphidium minutum]